MQGAKKAGETIKETAANIGASAKSGMDKTKATVQEKTEKMTARDPMLKEMATQKKEAKINQAELDKQAAREHNAAAKQSATAGHMGPAGTGTATYSTTGNYGQPTGAHQMSTIPGHGTGQPTGHVTEHNAAATTGHMGPAGIGTATYSTTGNYGQPTGAHQMSAMPGHGTGQPTGHVTDGVAGSHPIGMNRSTDGTATAHNTRVGGNPNASEYGTGGTYSK